MKYCVMDTGLNGSIILVENGKPVDALVFQRLGRGLALHPITEKLKSWQPDKIYIEGIPAMPHQGVKQTATQWYVFGQCETIAELHSEEIEIIPAIRWASFTKRLSTTPHNPSKVIAQELAAHFFPDFSAPYLGRKYRGVRKIHDGIADCLCMILYVERDYYVEFIQESL